MDTSKGSGMRGGVLICSFQGAYGAKWCNILILSLPKKVSDFPWLHDNLSLQNFGGHMPAEQGPKPRSRGLAPKSPSPLVTGLKRACSFSEEAVLAVWQCTLTVSVTSYRLIPYWQKCLTGFSPEMFSRPIGLLASSYNSLVSVIYG